MQTTAKNPFCQKNHKAVEVCVSSVCQWKSAFICNTSQCLCQKSHRLCKIMKWESFNQIIMKPETNFSVQTANFIQRINQIYQNLINKIEKQRERFKDYFQKVKLGVEYQTVKDIIRNNSFSKLNPKLVASSIQNLTKQSQIKYEKCSVSQMRRLEQSFFAVFQQIQQIYTSKLQKAQAKNAIFKRSSSVTLQKSDSVANDQMTMSSIVYNDKINKNAIIANNLKKTLKDDYILNLKVDLTYPKFINSKVLDDATSTNVLIGHKVKKYHLIYRASQNKFSINEFYKTAKHFYDQMERKNQTVKKLDLKTMILIKTEFGKVLGGFTQLNWIKNKPSNQNIASSDEEEQITSIKGTNHLDRLEELKYKEDNCGSTSLFSVDLMEKYSLLHPSEAIYCGRKSIGFGRKDLKVTDQANTNRKSYCKFPVSFNYLKKPYTNKSKSGMQLSGARYSQFFKIIEWELFYVQNLK